MKKIILGFSTMLILSGCLFGPSLKFSEKDSDSKNNLILNSGFESGEFEQKSLPKNWIMLNQKEENSVLWSNKAGRDESKALVIDAQNSSVTLISDAFTIDSYGSYYARCFFEAEENKNSKIQIHFVTFDEKGNRLNEFKGAKRITNGWNKVEVSAGFFKKNSKFARVLISVPSTLNQSITLDDVGCFFVQKISKY